MKRFDRAWWENHLRYQGVKYVALAIMATLGWSMIFSVTEYRVPPNRSVDVYFVGGYADYDKLEDLGAAMKADLPHIEQIKCYNIALAGDQESVAASEQKLFVYMGSGEGDIYVFSRQQFLAYADQGAFLSLDGYVAGGALRPQGDLSLTTLNVPTGEGVREKHLVGVSLAGQNGLRATEGFDNRNSIMGLMSYSTNPDEAVQVMQWILDHRTQDAPAAAK